MTVKKGGRESGADILRKMNADAAKIPVTLEPPPERLIDAAANPAVVSPQSRWQWKHRVEEIEKDRDAWRQRTFDLEAELVAVRKAYAIMESGIARAERAEARVADLERIVHKDRPHRFVGGICQDCEAREREED